MTDALSLFAASIHPESSVNPIRDQTPWYGSVGVIDTVAANGSVTLYLNASSNAVPAHVISGVLVNVGDRVEVLDANGRLLVIGSLASAPAVPTIEMSTVEVGAMPPAGTPWRHIRGTVVETVTSFGASFVTIDLTSLALAYGYTPLVSNGDPQTSVIGEVGVLRASCTLTALVVQVWAPGGTAVSAGASARINYDIVGV